MAGFVRFSFDGLSEAMIRGGLGHLEVAPDDRGVERSAGRLDRPASAAFADWRPLRARLEGAAHVVAVGANLHVMGLAQRADGAAVAFAGVGVEPDRERRMGFATRLRSGEPLSEAPPAAGEDVALLALGLAESLGAAPGDTVTLVTADSNGMLNALDIRVLGIFTTGVAELDTRLVKLPLATAARLAQTESISNLLVVLDERQETEPVAARLRVLLAGESESSPRWTVTSWQERAPFYTQVRALYLGIFRFLGAIVVLLVVLATSNTLVMTVFERMRELGTLRAIGTTPGQIATILAAEAAALALLGSGVGALGGALGILAINAANLEMPPPPGAVDPIDLQLAFVPEAFAGAIALMLVVLLVASLFPIARAIRMPVVEALGHV